MSSYFLRLSNFSCNYLQRINCFNCCTRQHLHHTQSLCYFVHSIFRRRGRRRNNKLLCFRLGTDTDKSLLQHEIEYKTAVIRNTTRVGTLYVTKGIGLFSLYENIFTYTHIRMFFPTSRRPPANEGIYKRMYNKYI